MRSNVTEQEVNQDEDWYSQELDLIGCSLESGEGDPSDLYATEYRSVSEKE